MLSFSQLTTPVTEAEALEDVLSHLTTLGFAATSWQEGSVQHTICRLVAWLFSRMSEYAATVATGSVSETASGEYLTRLSRSVYQNERKPAVAAQYTVVHTLAGGEGPHTIAVGALVATNGVATYRNIAGATLNSGTSPLSLVYECEEPGAVGATAANTLTTLVTPLAGVTINNPATSPVVAGRDEETDAALRERNALRWAELSIDMPADGYRSVALAVDGIGRAAVDDTNPRGPGTADVYVAAASSTAAPADVTAADTAIQARRSVCADVLVQGAAASTVTVAGTVYVSAAYAAAAATAVPAAISAYVDNLAIGGATLTTSTKGVPLDGILAAIRSVSGVLNVNLSSPAADQVLNDWVVAVANTSGVTVTGI